jgi:PII-like signaling protein
MPLTGKAKLLRMFLGERDKIGHQPLFEAIVEKARKMGLAGATVLRGVEGFGAASVIHKAKLLELSEDLPFVIEIIDSEEKIQAFIGEADKLLEEAGCGVLITLETVEIIKYTPPKNAST